MQGKVLLQLWVSNGCLEFFDNGHQTLHIDLKETSLGEANKQLFFYLRHITTGLYAVYNKRGYRYG